MSVLNPLIRLSVFVCLFVIATEVSATVIREDIGELKIHDLLIRPNFALKKPRDGGFSIGESSFALRWELEDKFSGVVRIGPWSLLNPVARFSSDVKSDITLVEAFAEYDHPYGRIRMGTLPVEFGYEGKQWERALIFPRALLFRKRAMMLRDLGASYEISYNGFFTGLVVHNGKSDTNVDGQIWYTARWGYKGDDFEVGLAGQTGWTRPIATKTSNDTLAGVDPTQTEKWRIGGLYGALTRPSFEWVAEFYMGTLDQESQTHNYYTGHTDFGYEWTKAFSTHFRYDLFEPNTRAGHDLEENLSLALVMSNRTKSSNLILVGTKVLAQSGATPTVTDEVRLIWNLSPSGEVRF